MIKLACRACLCVLMLGYCIVCRGEDLAITFDDLPLNGTLQPGATPVQVVDEVLAILKSRQVPPVYGFINSKKLEGNLEGAEALARWVAGGQRVGSHTYSHMDLHQSTVDAFTRDIALNEPELKLLDAADNWRWFRYPYLHEGDALDKRRSVRSYLQQHHYRIAQVTIDYEDYLWNSAYARCAEHKDEESIAWLRSSYLSVATEYIELDRQMARLVFDREIKHVLLLHLGAFSSTILPDLLDLLRDKGFKLVTLEAAQSDPAYETDPDAPASRFGGSLLEQWMDARQLKYPEATRKPYQQLDAICR
jgi:peptidoglycan-N-acetylglucosamine deacetylase